MYSLYRCSSFSAGSSICGHCSAKTFTVAPDLEEAEKRDGG